MSTASDYSSSPSATPSPRRSTPEPPVQPDHFYGSEQPIHLPSPHSDGRTWLTPDDDPLAQRGIPVFKPTLEEFQDFEGYLNKIQYWGMKSGIVKVIPPKEWKDALPALTNQLAQVKLRNPIEQHMFGRGGLFRQENVEKRRIMSVREWSELCAKEDMRAPGVDDIGLHARATNGSARPRSRRTRKKRESETAEPDQRTHEIKQEEDEAATQFAQDMRGSALASPPLSATGAASPPPVDNHCDEEQQHVEAADSSVIADAADSVAAQPDDVTNEAEANEEKPKSKGKRNAQTRQAREANLAERAAKDEAFLERFDPHSDWLPSNTTPFDYTPDFCKELERRYWRNCGLGKPAWYGADMQGSLFTEETQAWNVANLKSTLTRLLPASSKGLPGVNTPYLYFGMWRATFAWHVEDMDLFSINFVHFGAPKYWYAIPQARAAALEQTMRGYFPKDVSACSQFLRHKSFLASPSLLSGSSCRPNTLVQHAGEFVITFPRGYHAGFNLGFNCAESVNFALDSWLEIGRKAKACGCVNYSVRIDVDQLLQDREAERLALEAEAEPNKRRKSKSKEKGAKEKIARKRKSEDGSSTKAKKQKTDKAEEVQPEASTSKASKRNPPRILLKLGPKPKEPDTFPCCLCVSMSEEELLRVNDPPTWRRDTEGVSTSAVWMAHEVCANVIPETWIDEVEVGEVRVDGTRAKERVVYGVDAIVKDRWNLKCTACTKTRYKAHGAPIQCTKGKCPKAFHVSCARDGAEHNIVYTELGVVEKEVILLDLNAPSQPTQLDPGPSTLAPSTLMDLDMHGQVISPLVESGSAEAGPQVLKLIKKIEVQVLCSQHNPAVTEAKRAVKQEKIRKDLLALPSMSRIKLRVSAGVFEVSLVRVIEESCSVEVLWDRGLKREFKWGSVVFGNTDGLTVGQKPTEPALDPELLVPPPPTKTPIHTSPPVTDYWQHTHLPATATTSIAQPTASSSMPPPTPTASTSYSQPPTYPSANLHYNPTNWRYQYPGPKTSTPWMGTSMHYYTNPASQPYSHTVPYGSTSYHPYTAYSYSTAPPVNRSLQWQQPYTGPKPAVSSAYPASSMPTTQTSSYYAYAHGNANAYNPWAAASSAATAPSSSQTQSTTPSTSAAPAPVPVSTPAPLSSLVPPSGEGATSASAIPAIPTIAPASSITAAPSIVPTHPGASPSS